MNAIHPRRLTAAVLVAILLFAFAAPALAASTTMVATANVNIRSGPGTSYKSLGMLNKGKTIVKTGSSGDWAKVLYNNKTAYIKASYLKSYSGSSATPAPTPSISIIPMPTPTPTPANSLLYARVSTAVRKGAGPSYTAIGYLDPGDSITSLGTTTAGYYQVQLGSKIGYVAVSDVTTQASGSYGTVYALTGTTVYSSATTASSTLGYLGQGQSAARTGTVGSLWTQITYSGRTGYVLTAQVADLSGGGSTTSGTIYANSTVAVYNSASASSTILGYFTQGQSTTRTGTTGIWTQIVFGNQLGYVLTSQVSDWPGSTSNNGALYVDSTTPVYRTADASSSIIGYLTQGQAITRTGTTGSSWTQITFAGETGYIRTRNVVESTGGGQTPSGFTAVGRTMYSQASRVYCYSAPYEQTTYSVGYLSLNESVWAVSTNGSWVQVYVQGQSQPLYVPANKLGYSTAGSGTGTGILYVQYYTGAPTYSDMTGNAFLYTYRPTGSTISETVASIDRGVAVTVQSYISDWVYVSWSGRDNVTRSAYVKANRLGPTSP